VPADMLDEETKSLSSIPTKDPQDPFNDYVTGHFHESGFRKG
jgi:hypothetical protein